MSRTAGVVGGRGVRGVWRRVNLLGLAVLAGAILLWEVLVRTGLVDLRYLPAPSEVVSGATHLLETGEMLDALTHTVTAAVAGWAIAAVAGVLLGTLLGLVRPVWAYSMASVDALRALPIVAFVPVAVLLLGFSIEMEILVSFYAALWPVLLNTYAGIREVPPRLVETARVLRLGRVAEMWKLRLPAASAHIVTGLRLGLGVALVLTLVAEMVGNPDGLGYAMIQAGQSLQPEWMFAYVVAIGLTGIVLNALLLLVARLVIPGQMAAAGESA